MPSLVCMLKKLEHKGKIDKEELDSFIKKLDGHDEYIYNKAINDCLAVLKINHMFRTMEDDYVASVEAPFYIKVFDKISNLKEEK